MTPRRSGTQFPVRWTMEEWAAVCRACDEWLVRRWRLNKLDQSKRSGSRIISEQPEKIANARKARHSRKNESGLQKCETKGSQK